MSRLRKKFKKAEVQRQDSQDLKEDGVSRSSGLACIAGAVSGGLTVGIVAAAIHSEDFFILPFAIFAGVAVAISIGGLAVWNILHST